MSSPAPDPGERVAGGTFRTDPASSLEKLKAFRNPRAGPLMFWLRCASASGATRLVVDDARGSLTVAFDGAPLQRAVLEDPYGVLVGSTEGSEAARCFARGLLHAWGAGASEVEAVSGEGAERRRLVATPSETRVADCAEGAGTEIRIAIDSDVARLWSHPRLDEEIACAPRGHLWTEFTIEFRRRGSTRGRFTRGVAGAGELEFEEGGAAGRLSIPPWTAPEAWIDLYHHGVFAGPLRFPADWPFTGKIDDPLLSLDADQASVVRNERLEALRGMAERRGRDLAFKVCADARAVLPGTATLLADSPLARELWRRRLDEGPGSDGALQTGWRAALREALSILGFDLPRREREQVLSAAAAVAWLRALAASDALPVTDVLFREIVETPLFLGRNWVPLDLRQTAKALRRAEELAPPSSPREAKSLDRILLRIRGANC